MANLLANGDFRSGSVDLKIGNGSGTVATSTAAIGPWSLNCDETDVATNKYIRVRNIGVAAAVAASKVTEPPADVIGDSLLLIDMESGPLKAPGIARTGFAKVQQSVKSSPKALANHIIELNLFVYSKVSGTFGVNIASVNVYSGGTLSTNILTEAVQLVVGWNRVRRIFLHPNVLDTDPVEGAYISGSHLLVLDVDQGLFSNVNINVNTTVAITGVYFGLANDGEFDRVEEIIRSSAIAASIPNALPAGGTTGQVLKKNSSVDYDANFAPVLRSGTESTTTGTITLDLSGPEIDQVVLTGNPTFATSNLVVGAFKSIRIDSNGSSRTIAFPGSWLWLGTNYSAGVTLASGSAVLSLTSYGTTDANVIACYVPTA